MLTSRLSAPGSFSCRRCGQLEESWQRQTSLLAIPSTAQGAIARFAENDGVYDAAMRALDKGHGRAFGLAGGPTTAWLNDHRSHADVLEMFDAAIEAAEPLDRRRRRLWGDYSLRQLLDMKAEREAFMAKFIGDAD